MTANNEEIIAWDKRLQKAYRTCLVVPDKEIGGVLTTLNELQGGSTFGWRVLNLQVQVPPDFSFIRCSTSIADEILIIQSQPYGGDGSRTSRTIFNRTN
jgi:hypothetical protein